LIYTEKGRGSIVKGSKIKQSLMEFYSFGRRFKQKEEGEAYSKIVEKKEIICPLEVREYLDIKDEDKIYEITRIRYVEKEPVMLEISYLSQMLFPGLFDNDMENFSLYDMIEYSYKKNITKGREYIQPMISGTKESRLLNIEKESPVFLVKRITYSGEKPVEYRKSIIRGDRYVFYTEFS